MLDAQVVLPSQSMYEEMMLDTRMQMHAGYATGCKGRPDAKIVVLPSHVHAWEEEP